MTRVEHQPSTRRAFVGLGGAAFIKPSLPAKSASRIVGANDRINVGVIGAGMMGTAHLRALMRNGLADNFQLLGTSEIYKKYSERAKLLTGLDTRQMHHDYRDLLDRKDIDCVFIASPDHWHAQMALDAMVAGKDVYLEPPLGLNLPQADEIYRAVRQFSRVLQLGSQWVSHPRFGRARDIVQSGGIGELLWAQGSLSRNSRYGDSNSFIDMAATAKDVDWPRWLGNAPQQPFSGERYFRWRKYWEYSSGLATDLVSQTLTPLLFVVGQMYPLRVMSSGGIFAFKDRESPDTYSSVIEYPKFIVNLAASVANASAGRAMPEAIHGRGGSILIEPDRLTWIREPQQRVETFEFKVNTAELFRSHARDFFAAMRARRFPAASIELAHQAMVPLDLGISSYRTGEVRNFDPATRTLVWRGTGRPSYEGTGQNYPGERPVEP